MFVIDKINNRIEKVESTTFKQLGFKERENLQECITNNPSCLNEGLLIIQKEFDGFNETNERLDLLALDKHGNLMATENKLDYTSLVVTWQVLVC
jgi:RecB family endonuclease NucS